ncbi:unnamed protein product, partial [Ectocarpus sp. 13 AM-2016]
MSQQQQQPQLRGQGREASSAVLGASARKDNVFAFDFDGAPPVATSKTAFPPKGAGQLINATWLVLSSIVDKMKELRPIVETGYENILLVRLLIEEVGWGPHPQPCSTTISSGIPRLGLPVLYPSEGLFDSWGSEARDALALRYGVGREELVDAFGSARDEWMEADFQGWLWANKFYEGIPEAISACTGEVYVITTKQTRFASALLEHAG